MSEDHSTLAPRVLAPARPLGQIVVEVVERGGEIRYRIDIDPPLSAKDGAEVQRAYGAIVEALMQIGVADTDGDG